MRKRGPMARREANDEERGLTARRKGPPMRRADDEKGPDHGGDDKVGDAKCSGTTKRAMSLLRKNTLSFPLLFRFTKVFPNIFRKRNFRSVPNHPPPLLF